MVCKITQLLRFVVFNFSTSSLASDFNYALFFDFTSEFWMTAAFWYASAKNIVADAESVDYTFRAARVILNIKMKSANLQRLNLIYEHWGTNGIFKNVLFEFTFHLSYVGGIKVFCVEFCKNVFKEIVGIILKEKWISVILNYAFVTQRKRAYCYSSNILYFYKAKARYKIHK